MDEIASTPWRGRTPTGGGAPDGTDRTHQYHRSMRVVLIAGARPNFMKIKPVLDALEARGAETVLVHTGQHYDAGMSDVFFEELGIRTPDHSLGVGSGSHAAQTGRIMTAFEE